MVCSKLFLLLGLACTVGFSSKLGFMLPEKIILDIPTPLAGAPYETMYTINGNQYDAATSELNFNDSKNIVFDTFVKELIQFPNLEKIELCNTNLTYEQLEAIRDLFPNIKVIWTVTLANYWTIRTDAVAFSTNKAHRYPELTNDEVWKLKYCTDLVALDIGHNHVSDLSFLEYLPNLKILIVADNWITDLTPVSCCKKLMYIETFVNPIRDISALTEMDSLVDINVSYNYFSDYTPLLNKPNLERLHITHTSLSADSINILKATYPEVRIEHSCGTSVEGGWRQHPRYTAMREMFLTNTINDLFTDKEEIEEINHELTP